MTRRVNTCPLVKCVSCPGTRSVPRSPKVSELRQNGVISMNHLNWHAHAAIRDFV